MDEKTHGDRLARGRDARPQDIFEEVSAGSSLPTRLVRRPARAAAVLVMAGAALTYWIVKLVPIPWHSFLPVDGGPHLAVAIAGPAFAKVAGARAVVPLAVDADAAYTVYVRFDQAGRCWKFPVDTHHPVRLFVPPVEGLFYYTNSQGPGPLLRRRDPLYFTVDRYDNQTLGRQVRITSGRGGDIPVSPSEVAHCVPLVTN